APHVPPDRGGPLAGALAAGRCPARRAAGARGGRGMTAALDRLLGRAADAVLAWSAGQVEPAQLAWIDALRGELAVVDGGPARLRWALGGLALAISARRRSLNRMRQFWPALLRHSAFGLGLGAVLAVGIVWSNVIVPTHESDDEYTAWYAVFYAGL